MSKSLSRVSAIVGGIAAGSLTVGALLIGCGDDTAVPLPDATTDGRLDVARVDAAKPVDGAPDAAVPDSAPEATVDAGSIFDFPAAQATALCVHAGHCCDGPDAAAFNEALCENMLLTGGGLDRNFAAIIGPDGGNLSTMTRGKVKFDSVAAASCIAGLGALSCPVYGSVEYRNVIQNCYAALSGTVGVGQTGCIDSVECVKGAYCQLNTDGGEGSCVALAAPGGACGPDTNDMCAYRGYIGNERCDIYKYGDAGKTFKCIAQQPIGSGCTLDWECASGLCDFITSKCVQTLTFVDPVTCASYHNKDGG